jgi:hypothetical protein
LELKGSARSDSSDGNDSSWIDSWIGRQSVSNKWRQWEEWSLKIDQSQVIDRKSSNNSLQ